MHLAESRSEHAARVTPPNRPTGLSLTLVFVLGAFVFAYTDDASGESPTPLQRSMPPAAPPEASRAAIRPQRLPSSRPGDRSVPSKNVQLAASGDSRSFAQSGRTWGEDRPLETARSSGYVPSSPGGAAGRRGAPSRPPRVPDQEDHVARVGSAGDLISFSHRDPSGKQLITVISASKQAMSVYYVSQEGIRLLSSRAIDADFTILFNATSPLPDEIRRLDAAER